MGNLTDHLQEQLAVNRRGAIVRLKGFARLLWTLLAILLLLLGSVGGKSAERPAPDFEVLSGNWRA